MGCHVYLYHTHPHTHLHTHNAIKPLYVVFFEARQMIVRKIYFFIDTQTQSCLSMRQHETHNGVVRKNVSLPFASGLQWLNV